MQSLFEFRSYSCLFNFNTRTHYLCFPLIIVCVLVHWLIVTIPRVDCSYVLFFSMLTNPFPRRLPSPCMTPEDDMWSRITWLTVWATCLRRVLTRGCLRYDYCTITYAYIWTFTAMSAHVWAYESWLSWTIDDNCLSPNGSNSNQCHEHSHRLAITVLWFSYLSCSLSRPTL